MKTLHGSDSDKFIYSDITEIEKEVLDTLKSRWVTGREKYGIGISEFSHTSPTEWIEEAIEECADQLQYLVACKMLLNKTLNSK